MALTYDAMMFARKIHANQRRKYTKAPYFDHLAEVAGIVAAVGGDATSCAVAWLHDCMEDQSVGYSELTSQFGYMVAAGVLELSDLEKGNRAERKAMSRDRLAKAPGWVQTIKCADLISNTSSIVQHDPTFARLYLAEKHALLDVMTSADKRLLALARDCARPAVG